MRPSADQHTPDGLNRALVTVGRELDVRRNSTFARYFPDCTARCRNPDSPDRRDHAGFCRALYRKHLLFLTGGAKHRETMLIAGNRVGKTDVACFATKAHLTGRYPKWWEGHRFEPTPMKVARNEHISAWAAGDTGKTVRDIIQQKLVGPVRAIGNGMLTNQDIEHWTRKQGINEAVETVWVKHVEKHHGAPLISRLEFKSYDQRRESFQGTAQDLILLDEEPPEDVYNECLLRTMSTGEFPGGKMMLTFTPLMGLTPVVRRFLPEGKLPEEGVGVHDNRLIVNIQWEEVAHLSESERREILASMPEHERDAREKGVPILGAGLIYITPETDFVVDPFPIPDEWPRGYGMDVGWDHDTAVAWLAYDKANDTLYLHDEHKQKHTVPGVHAAIIKTRGAWQPGRLDPSSNTPNQIDGAKLFEHYRSEGLSIEMAPNAVEAGITHIQRRLSTGRFRVFRTCTKWLSEYRSYHRRAPKDGSGKPKIYKVNDDLLDATRYFCNSDDRFLWLRTPPKPAELEEPDDDFAGVHGWMGM